MRFTPSHLLFFARLSHDRNPLHTDPGYATRTPLGHVVVYGVWSILCGLGLWANGRGFLLKGLRVQFRKPLYVDEDYSTEVRESGETVSIQLKKGRVPYVDVRFTWRPYQAPAVQADSITNFQPLSAALDPEVSELGALGRAFDYQLDRESLRGLVDASGLSPAQLPEHQLTALCGASYLVGMCLPGRQALFSEIDIVFEPAPPGGGGPTFQDVSSAFDESFGLLTIDGRGAGLSSFRFRAFRRPAPVEYPIELVRREVMPSNAFRDRTVFITGSSRGFGAVLAKAFALQGANLVLHYRSQGESAARVVDEISPLARVTLVGGDLLAPDAIDRISGTIVRESGLIDVLVCNAIPPLQWRNFLEHSPSEFLRFVEASVGMVTNVCHVLLAKMSPGGTVLLVSSRASKEPERGLSHYVAAKAATEGVMRTLALEFRELRFVIARPPRMLTDQTNTSFSMQPPASAAQVAGQLLSKLSSLDSSRNLHELDL